MQQLTAAGPLLSHKLTTDELARELKRSPATIIRWRRERRGPPYIRLQGRVLYDRSQVESWMLSNTITQ